MEPEFSTHFKRRRNKKAEDRKVNKIGPQVKGWGAQNEEKDILKSVQAQYEDK